MEVSRPKLRRLGMACLRYSVYRERGHRRLSLHVPPLADRFQPAVLHMLRETIQAGRHTRIGVCLCGELAADPIATSVLIGIGLEEFSVSPQLIPELSKQLPAGRSRKPKQSRAKR